MISTAAVASDSATGCFDGSISDLFCFIRGRCFGRRSCFCRDRPSDDRYGYQRALIVI